MLKKIDSEYVVKYYDDFKFNDSYYLIIEFCN